MKLTFLLLLLCATAPSAWGWSNHTVGSYLALQDLPALRDAPAVEVEPLEQFLTEQYPAVLALLEQQESFNTLIGGAMLLTFFSKPFRDRWLV